MVLVLVLAIWLVLSLLVGLFILALCRAGRAEDDHWAVMDPEPPQRRRRDSSRTPV